MKTLDKPWEIKFTAAKFETFRCGTAQVPKAQVQPLWRNVCVVSRGVWDYDVWKLIKSAYAAVVKRY